MRLKNICMMHCNADKARYEGLIPDVISYSSYVRGCSRKGDLDAAREALREMAHYGIAPNEWTYAGLVEVRLKDREGACWVHE